MARWNLLLKDGMEIDLQLMRREGASDIVMVGMDDSGWAMTVEDAARLAGALTEIVKVSKKEVV